MLAGRRSVLMDATISLILFASLSRLNILAPLTRPSPSTLLTFTTIRLPTFLGLLSTGAVLLSIALPSQIQMSLPTLSLQKLLSSLFLSHITPTAVLKPKFLPPLMPDLACVPATTKLRLSSTLIRLTRTHLTSTVSSWSRPGSRECSPSSFPTRLTCPTPLLPPMYPSIPVLSVLTLTILSSQSQAGSTFKLSSTSQPSINYLPDPPSITQTLTSTWVQGTISAISCRPRPARFLSILF
nr:MAG: hypothetical protein [Picornavirales sp.]